MPLFNSGRIYLAHSADTNFCQLNNLREHAISDTSSKRANILLQPLLASKEENYSVKMKSNFVP